MKPGNLQVLLEKVLISAELFLKDKGRNEIGITSSYFLWKRFFVFKNE